MPEMTRRKAAPEGRTHSSHGPSLPPPGSLHRIRSAPAAILTAAVAAMVFVPYLGAVGLWDPWETHYGEVARQMVARGDLVHPYWETGWFFSKPPLTMWLSVPALWLTGAADGTGALSRSTEWGMRLPFAGLAILAVAVLAHAVERLASRRAALVTGFVLSTMPLFFFIARQAMTDMPFVATLTVSLSCAAIAWLDEDTRLRTRWWIAAAVFAGLSTLAKGLLGVLLPTAVLGVFLFASSVAGAGLRRHLSWIAGRESIPASLRDDLQRVRWPVTVGTFAAVAVPWYALMIAFEGRDFENRTFFERFFLHDHFARLAAGVHTTTPGGTFTYFIEQGGFGVFPWVALVPAALVVAAQTRFDVSAPRARLTALATVWAVGGFVLFSSSATKFHHYLLPVLPPLAVLIGLAVDRLAKEPLREWAGALALGAALFALVARDLFARPRHLVDLFTYNHGRPYPDVLWSGAPLGGLAPKLDAKELFGGALAIAGVLIALAALAGARRIAGAALGATALVLALWLSWGHWVDLSHHWTQRDLFWRYHQQRGPNEPIGAYLMDWKGETFYSRNRVVQIKPGHEKATLDKLFQVSPRVWFLVEHTRYAALQRAIGPHKQLTRIDPGVNNKFVLVRAE